MEKAIGVCEVNNLSDENLAKAVAWLRELEGE